MDDKQFYFNLPFKEKWFVVSGGDSERQNSHNKSVNQKFAFDFLIIDSRKKSFKDKGLKNNDYYCFKKKILAPASGRVVKVVEEVKDNKPGLSNKPSCGNAVFIMHARGLVSVFAHLKRKSIKVKIGDRVKIGQVIGLCGNSGHTSEPHLHFHLQDKTNSKKASGVKCYFQKICVKKKGEFKEKMNYSPVREDIVWQK